MTDEEKWETWRNANAEIQKPYGGRFHKHIVWYEGVDRRKAFLDGLAEGRKEVCQICEKKMIEANPNIKGCAYRKLGNEYCWEKEEK